MRKKKEINIQVGNAIRTAREQAGLTQEQFGEIVALGAKMFPILNAVSQVSQFLR